MADHLAAESTQTAHPWRATVRTAFAAVVGLAAAWGLIVGAAGVDPGLEWVSGSVAIAAGITRVMALPAVDNLIRQFVPWLAPDKPSN
ncbi:hypothetical protein [Paenarthrobacter ilicis]|uniref:hypothetical protein n=1 Tax=Paenarthrobacter ilicis TaxID=43665 RepID=UPI003863D6FD